MPEVTISQESADRLRELWQGMRDEHDDTRSQAELVDDAIRRVHRGFVGLAPGEPGGPDQPTGPFRKWASDRWAEVLLRQVDHTTFRLAQPFRYHGGDRQFDVPEDDVTDLASVPRFLTWLVPRYGRHTLAALAHDHLQDVDDVSSEEADVIFRDSMGQTGVPLSRRWLMWSAVALRTEWKRGGARAVRVALWVAIFTVIALGLWPTLVVVLGSAFSGEALLRAVVAVVVAAVLPIAFSWTWGRHWRVGALGGTALVFFAVPVAIVLLALGSYLLLEWAAEHAFVRRSERNPVLTGRR